MQMTGKFDLVITSHLFEDLTDPMVPRSSNRGCNLMTSGEMLLTIDDQIRSEKRKCRNVSTLLTFGFPHSRKLVLVLVHLVELCFPNVSVGHHCCFLATGKLTLDRSNWHSLRP